ncbi:MAG: hypothetical protein KAT11_07685 [Phycisphaerae bacterium]|nr:hypothetical protein [Phycisphaerae bacterium]
MSALEFCGNHGVKKGTKKGLRPKEDKYRKKCRGFTTKEGNPTEAQSKKRDPGAEPG